MQRDYLIKREVKKTLFFETVYEYNYEMGRIVLNTSTGKKEVEPDVSIVEVKATPLTRILRLGGIAIMLATIVLVCIATK